MNTFLTLTYGLAIAVATVLGGMLISSQRVGQETLRNLIALGSGFMLAAVFLRIVPESLALWPGDEVHAMGWLLGGYLLVQLIEHTLVPHFHFGEETHHDALVERHVAAAGLAAFLLHSFFDGVSIAVASLVSPQLGALIFIAVLLHKMPEGFTVASVMLAAGRSNRKALASSFYVGIAALAGVALVIVAKDIALYSRPLSSYVLPLSAGITLHVAASDLIPEVNKRQGGVRTSLLVFAGVALLYVIEVLLEALGMNHG